MTDQPTTTDSRIDDRPSLHHRGHLLVAVDQWLPQTEPTPHPARPVPLSSDLSRFWRCRYCGQERSHPDDFLEACDHPPESILDVSGYTIEDPRTRRALTESMTVHYGALGPTYSIDSASGRTYDVDIESGTCSCPDFRKRAPRDGCKHLRRVTLEILAGCLPRPDGVFNPR